MNSDGDEQHKKKHEKSTRSKRSIDTWLHSVPKRQIKDRHLKKTKNREKKRNKRKSHSLTTLPPLGILNESRQVNSSIHKMTSDITRSWSETRLLSNDTSVSSETPVIGYHTMKKPTWLEEFKELPLPAPLYQKVTELTPQFLPDKVLLWISPEENPFLWIFINGFVVFSSLFLFTALSVAEKDDSIIDFAQNQFYNFNFFTTLVWILRIGSSVWRSSRNHDELTWAQSFEMILAVYLALHSLQLLFWHENYKASLNRFLLDAFQVEVRSKVCARLDIYS